MSNSPEHIYTIYANESYGFPKDPVFGCMWFDDVEYIIRKVQVEENSIKFHYLDEVQMFTFTSDSKIMIPSEEELQVFVGCQFVEIKKNGINKYTIVTSIGISCQYLDIITEDQDAKLQLHTEHSDIYYEPEIKIDKHAYIYEKKKNQRATMKKFRKLNR